MPINMVQKFLVQVDSVKLLGQYLRLSMITALNSHEELAVKVVDRNKMHLPLHLPAVFMDKNHFPVIFIGGWYSPKEGEKNSYFGGYGP